MVEHKHTTTMNKIYLLFALFIANFSYSQAPSGYYTTASGTGYTLKTQLYNIIKNHTDKGYNGLWTTYSTSDRDHQNENDNTIFDLYSENQNGADPYTFAYGTKQCGNYSVEGDCYNREHMIPQSVFNSSAPMVSDAHFIPPTDGKVNGLRSNYPHGNVSSASTTTRNGSKLGSSSVSGYVGTVFEPANDFKGDIARMYFYFATRYENTVANYNYAMFNRSSNQVFTQNFLDMLLTWHNQDPVSAREIERNNAIYARQNNRNPFIDNPNYVNLIWNPTLDTQAPSIPQNLFTTNITTNNITLNWSASTDNIAVTSYDIYLNGVLNSNSTSLNKLLTGLNASTTYSFYVRAKDAAGNISSNSTSINATTSSPTATATDLYFSEYIEGSSNNKALEIANSTSSTISLSSYVIKKQTNGAGSWSTGLSLSGTLNSSAKYIIVNSSISSVCYNKANANISTTATELTFNGNDAVGLFKNGVLIDIIGNFNGGTSNFAADVTLRRKTSVTLPKSSFLISDWNSYSSDTCNNLGSRISNEDIADVKLNAYPNPNNGNFIINIENKSNSVSIEIYSLIGQKVFEKLNTNESEIQINNLSKGMYILNLSSENTVKTIKIIVQ